MSHRKKVSVTLPWVPQLCWIFGPWDVGGRVEFLGTSKNSKGTMSRTIQNQETAVGRGGAPRAFWAHALLRQYVKCECFFELIVVPVLSVSYPLYELVNSSKFI